jgi:hypothetical protein
MKKKVLSILITAAITITLAAIPAFASPIWSNLTESNFSNPAAGVSTSVIASPVWCYVGCGRLQHECVCPNNEPDKYLTGNDSVYSVYTRRSI